MTLQLTLQSVTAVKNLPRRVQFKAWLTTVLSKNKTSAEITLRIVDGAESAALNKAYRGIDAPTNVLTFVYASIPPLLPNEQRGEVAGDIVLCAPIVEAEALSQGKLLLAHWAHLTLHGLYHLLGHDHVQDVDAAQMEALEIEALAALGFPSPYETYPSLHNLYSQCFDFRQGASEGEPRSVHGVREQRSELAPQTHD